METPSTPHFDREDYARPWEHDASFGEVLEEAMRKFPYLLVSLSIHGVAALLLAGLAFLRPEESQAPELQVYSAPPPPEVEDLEKPPEPDIPEEITPEPQLQEMDLEKVETQESLQELGDPEMFDKAPFDLPSTDKAVGLGATGGGDFGRPGGQGGKRGSGGPTEAAVLAGLEWLAEHQSPEGFWDCDEFMFFDEYPNEPPSDGPGNAVNDVGVTGLALLAFLGRNSTIDRGPYRDNVLRGVNWLRRVQRDDGLFGEEVGNPTLYNHSIATMAMGEAHYFNPSPLLRKPLRKATNVLLRSQNPYEAWRYGLEPNADNDSSVTGWCVFALKTAEEGGLPIDRSAFTGAENWFATMTDPATGRTGYAFGDGGGPGSRPSRPRASIEDFPPQESEALTAVALLSRIFMTDSTKVKRWRDHPNYAILAKQADLIAQKPPLWDVDGGTCDMYYWYYATYAMNQWGGSHWKGWKRSMEKALLPTQRQDGNFKGSWDPVGPWGEDGGRVYSTALGVLMLEVYYRYNHVLGAR